MAAATTPKPTCNVCWEWTLSGCKDSYYKGDTCNQGLRKLKYVLDDIGFGSKYKLDNLLHPSVLVSGRCAGIPALHCVLPHPCCLLLPLHCLAAVTEPLTAHCASPPS